MDIMSGNKYPSCALSNFAPHPFTIDGVYCNSMEGFLQSLKFKNADMQAHVCTLVGFAAKKKGADKKWYRKQVLYWKGVGIKRDSDDYQKLLDRAYDSMFTQNGAARKALMSTRDSNLTHSIGKRKKSETILTSQEFCSRLLSIRKRFQASKYLIY